ncbi:MAG TPA: SIMPL domain-containing protein [Jatrophihabitans sp.]|nr:SIMPL domain-containing protein [Jatrophihabitans sp.]
MSEVVITVRGSYQSSQPPERATVHLSVQLEGREKAAVHTETRQVAAHVTGSIEPLFDREHGPVTWWASDQLRTDAYRPFNKDGKQLPPVYRAAIPFRVKFSDFGALGEWLTDISERDGVSVERIEWALTEKRRLALRDEARAAAVEDATRKAGAYATALGLGPVRPIALADPGMLGDNIDATRSGVMYQASRAAALAGGPAIEFVPQDVDIVAEVDARFVAEA